MNNVNQEIDQEEEDKALLACMADEFDREEFCMLNEVHQPEFEY